MLKMVFVTPPADHLLVPLMRLRSKMAFLKSGKWNRNFFVTS